jgi:glutamate transport system substrate-binding protein
MTEEAAAPDGSRPRRRVLSVLTAALAAALTAARHNARALRLVAVALTLVLAVVVAFVVVVVGGPPTVDELRGRAGLDGKRELLIGVKDDQPGIAERQADGSFAGFDIEIAYLVAAELGFRRAEVRFLAIQSEDRARMQATDSDGRRTGVDLVIASYSITPVREAAPGVSFSAPYLYTEQSVVTLRGHEPVSTLADLKDRKVCSLATATSGGPLRDSGALLVSRNRISECFAAMDEGKVEAVSTDAAILAGFVAREPEKLTHHDIGYDPAEAWGINVGEDDALRDLVNLALYRSRNDPADARWEEAFDRHLRRVEPVNRPAPVAVAQQPRVPRVDVRQWPWQRVALPR